MKLTDLIFTNDSQQGPLTFLQECLLHPDSKICSVEGGEPEFHAFVNQLLDKAENTDDFVNMFLDNKKYRPLQCYQELIKRERPDRAWYFVRENFGNRCIKISSDAGGVRFGTKDFSLIVPNGYGDGITRLAVFENYKAFYSDNIMQYFTSVNGRFSIFGDCGDYDQTIADLDGDYFVYTYRGLVAFVPYY